MLIPFLNFCFIAFIYAVPLLKNINNWGVWDWDYDTFLYAVSRKTILEYHQIPLWNPYINGGVPLLAHPYSKFLNPFFIFVILFGEVIGIKIIFFIHLAIGLFGTYILLRQFYKLNYASSLVASFIYMLNGFFTLTYATGMSNYFFAAYIPYIFLFFQKSFLNWKYVIPTCIFLVLIFFGGGHSLFVITLTFIFIYSLLIACQKKYQFKKILKIFISIITLAFCLGAVKLLPSIEVMYQFPRYVKDYSGYSFNSLIYSLFNHNQSIDAEKNLPLRAFGFWDGISYGMNENGIYIGILPFLLFLIGFIFYFRKLSSLALSFILFLWLSFGNRIPIKIFRIWGMIRKLPIYNTMRVAQRFRFIFMLCLAIFAGFGLSKINYILKEKVKRKYLVTLFNFCLLIFIFIDLFNVNSLILYDSFTIRPFKLPKSNNFYQIWRNPKYDKNGMTSFESDWYRSRSSLYPTFLANIGTICGYEPMPVPRNAIPKEDKHYQGEVFLQDTNGEATITRWTPNRIKIAVKTSSDGYLVLNQNYYSGWKVKADTKKHSESVNQLLGVKVNPSDKQIEFYYLPASFIIGLIVSLAALFLTIIFLTTKQLKTRF